MTGPAPHDLPAADRFGEGRTDNPNWNESVWFSLSIPERRLHGMIQYYFRPNMGMLNGGPVLWDASGLHQWNCLHYQWSHLQALPAGAEKFRMTARNSLSVTVIEPLTRYKIDYDHGGLMLDLTWHAAGPTGSRGSRGNARSARAASSSCGPCSTSTRGSCGHLRGRAASPGGRIRRTRTSTATGRGFARGSRRRPLVTRRRRST